MNKKRILLPIILATLLFGILPLAAPSRAYVTSPTTVPPVVTVGNPVTGILNQTDDTDAVIVEIASPGLYEIQVKAESINLTQTSTGDVDVRAYMYQIVGTTDPYTDQVIENRQYITHSFSDLYNLYPGGYAVWSYYAAVVQPGSYMVEIEVTSSLSGYRAAEYTVSVSSISSLDDTSASVNANTSIPWASTDSGAKMTYFDVSTEGVYNFTFSQEVPAYHTGSGFNVSVTSATFDINIQNFDDSDERVEVWYNGAHIGDIYRSGHNYFPVPTNEIHPGSSDNVTIYYYNLTSPSSDVDINGAAYLHVYRDNGYDHTETWESGVSWSDGATLDFSTDSTWQTEGIYWYVASAVTYMDLIDSDGVEQIDLGVVPPFRLTNNETWDKTATSLGYFYLPAGRYHLIWDRDFPRINETTAVLIESITTETLNPGGSVTLSTNDTTYVNDSKGVILNLTPDTMLYNISASVTGVNWTAWAIPILYGERHSLPSTRVYYEETTYPGNTYYESTSAYDFAVVRYERYDKDFVGSYPSYPYITFGYRLLNINGTKSFSGGINFNLIHSRFAYLLTAYPTSGTTGNSASASVTLSLSSGETIETISPGQTKTATGLNYTTGPRYGIFRLPVQAGNAYKITGTPAAYTSDGQWQLTAAPENDKDWLLQSILDAGSVGPIVNDSEYFIDVPVKSGDHYLIAMVPGGDTTAINVTVESISATNAPVGTPVGLPLDRNADEKFKLHIVRFNVAAGSRYTIHLRNKGMVGSPVIRYIIFDSEGLSPTRAPEISGLVPLSPAPVSGYLTYEQVFDIVPVISGPVYIYIDDLLLAYGGFIEVEIIGSAVGMGFPLGLAIGLPVGIGVGLVVMFWLNKKGIIGGAAST